MEISWLGQPSALFLLMLVILLCPIRAKSLPVMPAGKHRAALPATDETNREMTGLLSFLLHRIIKSGFKAKKKDCGEPLCPACEKPSGRNRAENQLVGNQVLVLSSILV